MEFIKYYNSKYIANISKKGDTTVKYLIVR